MSSKHYVFAPWQEFDKDATQHLIKASTPFAAALAFAIREWGLYHVAEKVYEVYDSRGSVVGKYTTPDWVDDSFGATMKDAFLVEVLVERNECKGAPDPAAGNGMSALAAIQGSSCGPSCGCHSASSAGSSTSAFTLDPPSSSAPLDWSTAKCRGCGETRNIYLIVRMLDGANGTDFSYDFPVSETPAFANGNVEVGDYESLTPEEVTTLVTSVQSEDFTVLCVCRGDCEDETSLELRRLDGTVEDNGCHILIEYPGVLASIVGVPFPRPDAVGGIPVAWPTNVPTPPASVCAATDDSPFGLGGSVSDGDADSSMENPEALTADHIEFASYRDGRVALQGVGYFEFYGGLDDESVPVIERGFRERHGLRLIKGNTFDTRYASGAEAAAALKADGAIHCPELQAFVDA